MYRAMKVDFEGLAVLGMRVMGRHFWIRVTWFIDRLSRGEYTCATDLAKAFDQHPQTARRTINALRDDYGAPIEWDAQAGTYKLDDPHWSLPHLPLSPDEVAAIAMARSLFKRITAPSLRTAMERFWRKFTNDLEQLAPAGAALAYSVSAMAPAWAEPDSAVMETCLRGLALGRRLEIEYQSPWNGQQSTRTVEPRHLLLYDGSYYLASHCLSRGGAVRLFNLRAIQKASLTTTECAERPFQIQEVVDSYGLVQGGRRRRVVLRIAPPQAARAGLEIWHAEQKDTLSPDGTLTRSFPVRGFAEVIRLVLSFGASAQVIKPRELARQVAEEIHKMAAALDEKK